MAWELDSDRPIFIQIVERIQMEIISGKYSPGDKLQRTGLVYSQRTSGRFITEDAKMIEELKNNLAQEQIKEFLENMSKLGYKKSETLSLIQEILEGEQA